MYIVSSVNMWFSRKWRREARRNPRAYSALLSKIHFKTSDGHPAWPWRITISAFSRVCSGCNWVRYTWTRKSNPGSMCRSWTRSFLQTLTLSNYMHLLLTRCIFEQPSGHRFQRNNNRIFTCLRYTSTYNWAHCLFIEVLIPDHAVVQF